MADLSNYSFTGCLSKDATVKTINGKSLVEFDVANNVGFGQYAKTNWLKVKWWGDRAVNAAPIFKKGCLVTGNGELTLNEYEGRDGRHANIEVTVFGLNLLRKPKGSSVSADAEPEEEETVF